jgi:hypothetical protein
MAGAAEGKVVANLFAPAGDWDVPAGFAKNGDTPFFASAKSS